MFMCKEKEARRKTKQLLADLFSSILKVLVVFLFYELFYLRYGIANEKTVCDMN